MRERGAPGLCPRGAFLSLEEKRSGALMRCKNSSKKKNAAILEFKHKFWQTADRINIRSCGLLKDIPAVGSPLLRFSNKPCTYNAMVRDDSLY